MTEEIKYAENIIVGVVHKQQWYWFISSATLWILNFDKYQSSFIKRFGIEKAPHLPAIREGLPVVDTSTAKKFLERLSEKRVTTPYLQSVIKSRISVDQLAAASSQTIFEKLNQTLELFPSLVISFDQMTLYSGYPEMLQFENYVPVGWKGISGNVFANIPYQHRYWWIEDENYFKYFGVKY